MVTASVPAAGYDSMEIHLPLKHPLQKFIPTRLPIQQLFHFHFRKQERFP